MNIIREWERRLNMVNEDIDGIESYLEKPPCKLDINTKDSILAQLNSKKKYQELIEQTIKELGGTK